MSQDYLDVASFEYTKKSLKLKRMGIDTHNEAIIYMHENCYICHSEGFEALSRIEISNDDHSMIGILNVIHGDSLLKEDEVGLSEYAWRLMRAHEGQLATFKHAKSADSLSYVRAKLFGETLTKEHLDAIMQEIMSGQYSNVQLAAFIAACVGQKMNVKEMTYLTEAMVNVGQKLVWSSPMVMDKHCIGGLAGNRTTPIVVSIIASNGLLIPKTSSRAITSPAGTADTMEVLTTVDLDLTTMKNVLDKEGGCFVWGGAINLSPADDILIRVERALDLDSQGQLVPSILSKKLAAGSTHVLIDIPVGPTAKLRSKDEAKLLKKQLIKIGKAIGLVVKPIITDGSEPIGRGIGPTLECRDVLQVLQNDPDCPQDLKARALLLAGELLEMGKKAAIGKGLKLAEETLHSGKAYEKFVAICKAQGGLKSLTFAKYQHPIYASRNGVITYINNRFIAKLAKLAGAPIAAKAGLELHVKLGQKISKGDLILTLHAEAPGELSYALDFLALHPNKIRIEDELV